MTGASPSACREAAWATTSRRSAFSSLGAGSRAKRLNSSTMFRRRSTSCRIVLVDSSNSAVEVFVRPFARLAQSLDRKTNGRQRVLELVRETLCDLLPCGDSFGLPELFPRVPQVARHSIERRRGRGKRSARAVSQRRVEVAASDPCGSLGELVDRGLKPAIEVTAKDQREPQCQNGDAGDPQKKRRASPVELLGAKPSRSEQRPPRRQLCHRFVSLPASSVITSCRGSRLRRSEKRCPAIRVTWRLPACIEHDLTKNLWCSWSPSSQHVRAVPGAPGLAGHLGAIASESTDGGALWR